MSDELPPDDVRLLWQSQPAEQLQLSAKTIRKKARRFQRGILRRNLLEIVAGAVAVACCGWFAWNAESVVSRIGYGLLIAGVLYVVHRLITKGSSRQLPPDLLAVACLAFHRRELERQRDLLRSVWRWYLGPLVPGLVLVFVARALDAIGKGPHRVLGVGVSIQACRRSQVVASLERHRDHRGQRKHGLRRVVCLPAAIFQLRRT